MNICEYCVEENKNRMMLWNKEKHKEQKNNAFEVRKDENVYKNYEVHRYCSSNYCKK